MKYCTKFFIRTSCLLLFIFISSSVWAIPMAEITYLETDLGDGTFQYDYNVANTSHPIDDMGFDIFELFFTFDSTAIATIDSVRDDWLYGTGMGFIDTYSDLPGAPPDGADIGPGMSSNEFSFIFTERVGEIDFAAIFWDSVNDYFGGEFGGTTVPIPEPATLLLLTAGMIGMGAFGRKKFRQSKI